MSSDEKEDEKETLFTGKHYFDLDAALTDVNLSSGAKDTAVETAKLVGKSLLNVGVFAGKLGLGMLKQAPHTLARHAEDQIKNSPDLSGEQRDKYQEVIDKSKAIRKQEYIDERERREEERNSNR